MVPRSLVGSCDQQLGDTDRYEERRSESKHYKEVWYDGKMGHQRHPRHEGHAAATGPNETWVKHSGTDQAGAGAPVQHAGDDAGTVGGGVSKSVHYVEAFRGARLHRRMRWVWKFGGGIKEEKAAQ